MKKSEFRHLFSQKKGEKAHLPTKTAKKAVLVLFVLFLLLYIQYKPYANSLSVPANILEYLFTLYRFIITQTLGIVHEGGHGVCYLLPCPQFLMVLNGTLFQWAFPLGIGYYYKKRGNLMAFYIGLFILGISMDHTAWYMSTAHEGPILPAHKSFLGVDAIHDFHHIFSNLGVLSYASVIAGLTKAAGILFMIGAVIAMFFEAFSERTLKD